MLPPYYIQKFLLLLIVKEKFDTNNLNIIQVTVNIN